jgi:MFS family permease
VFPEQKPDYKEIRLSDTALPAGTTKVPDNYRRNFICLALDFGLFGLAMAFIGSNTVIPGYLTTLGASAAVVGAITSLQSASWLLPQLFAARTLADKPRKKPHILRPAAAGRLLFLVLGLVLWLTHARPAWLMLILSTVAIIGFWIGDGLASVPWFDLLSKAIPARRRGRLTSAGQVLSGVLGFAAGFAVEWLLSSQGPSFPNNYVSILLLGFAFLAASFVATSLIVEPSGAPTDRIPSWREYLPQLWHVLKNDHAFRRFILARQLLGLSGLATPFYMTYALTQLDLPAQVAGRYTSISVVGSILTAVLMGWINERSGSKRVILLSIGLATSVPVLALVIPWVLPSSGPALAWGYGLVFFAMSATMSAMMPGWMNFVLEHAPELDRPKYVGLTNTLNGVATLFSTLGGLILAWTDDNYAILFIATLAGLSLSWPLALRLQDPRHAHPTQVT